MSPPNPHDIIDAAKRWQDKAEQHTGNKLTCPYCGGQQWDAPTPGEMMYKGKAVSRIFYRSCQVCGYMILVNFDIAFAVLPPTP
jgi:DNA-directed RNA polymerase subunit RPC12/RpoP